jgi:hypothetical protein
MALTNSELPHGGIIMKQFKLMRYVPLITNHHHTSDPLLIDGHDTESVHY